jgi:hypothetical protein
MEDGGAAPAWGWECGAGFRAGGKWKRPLPMREDGLLLGVGVNVMNQNWK